MRRRNFNKYFAGYRLFRFACLICLPTHAAIAQTRPIINDIPVGKGGREAIEPPKTAEHHRVNDDGRITPIIATTAV